MKIFNIVGARPNFIKVAPLHQEFSRRENFTSRIIHTGQHNDAKMSDIFFRQLSLPDPYIHLGTGGGNHAEQTARIMLAFDKMLDAERPDLVLVVGDVNSTLACSLVAAKRHVPVAHVEAGLRSGDRAMPEEINRILTDQLSDFLFVSEESGLSHLAKEGIPADKIFLVGNVMIDALVQFQPLAAQNPIVDQLNVDAGQYILMTMHRPSNVDSEQNLRLFFELLKEISISERILFPIHPRTRQRFIEYGLAAELEALSNVLLLEPQGYIEFLSLMGKAKAVITDSGGIQEETTFLGIPCLTLRNSTERPATIKYGTNQLLPLETDEVLKALKKVGQPKQEKASIPPLWDGKSASRVVDILESTLQ